MKKDVHGRGGGGGVSRKREMEVRKEWKKTERNRKEETGCKEKRGYNCKAKCSESGGRKQRCKSK